MDLQERLESVASLVAAHGSARKGDVAKVMPRDYPCRIDSCVAVRLSSVTGGDMRLLQSWKNKCPWAHVLRVIWFAVFVVVQAHHRAVSAQELEDMSPMSVRVGVVVVALRLDDAKAHAHYARADDAPSETRRGSTQQTLPVVDWVFCHVLV